MFDCSVTPLPSPFFSRRPCVLTPVYRSGTSLSGFLTAYHRAVTLVSFITLCVIFCPSLFPILFSSLPLERKQRCFLVPANLMFGLFFNFRADKMGFSRSCCLFPFSSLPCLAAFHAFPPPQFPERLPDPPGAEQALFLINAVAVSTAFLSPSIA